MKIIFQTHMHFQKNNTFCFSEKVCVHKETHLEGEVKHIKQTKIRLHRIVNRII